MFLSLRKQRDSQEYVPEINIGITTTLRLVTADATRCVQCGICSHNCPVGIDVREYARRGRQVTDSSCIACSTCVSKCPRGTLRWNEAILMEQESLEVDAGALPVSLTLQPRYA